MWIAFSGDNGDIKFTQKLPILPETHEPVGTTEEQKTCCESRHFLDMLLDLQARQAAQAGYCGGYQTKVQPIGDKELGRFHAAFVHTLDGKAKKRRKPVSEHFKDYTRRFFKDMESKGTIRTVVECMDLAEYEDHPDPLMAECPRTFPSVTSPAGAFLKCAEIETGKTADGSVNRPMRHAYGSPGQAHLAGPIYVLYGYRGRAYNVDLHSPFEMMRFWKPVKITAWCGSRFTSAGVKYRDKCRAEGEPTRFRAGEHYVADLKARSWATDAD